ncbi:putative Sedolisin [Verrucomicrobia bacterium]|nr:putative Sedolisin [Verrucomicrobiota bacterium]
MKTNIRHFFGFRLPCRSPAKAGHLLFIIAKPRLSTIALCSLALLTFAFPTSGAERQVLRGHVPEAVARLGLQPLCRLPATNRLNLAIGLPLRRTNELAQLLHDLYDSASPRFRQYLTPEQFTEQFGPTSEDYEAVRHFAESHGLEVTATYPNRLLLDVAAQAANVEKAFQLTLSSYQHPTEARTFYAPDAEPSLALGVPLLAIGGLDNLALPHPMNLRRSSMQRPEGTAPPTGSGPRGAFLGNDFRAAYVPGVSLTGAGQTVGLLEFDGYYANDIRTYRTLAGLPNVPLSNVLLDGFDGSPSGANSEVALDIEMAISMAPGLSGVIVYEAGPNGLAEDMLNRMATDNLAKQLSSSWGWRPYDPNSEQIFQEFAAQGQSFFNASGDSDAYVGAFPWSPMDDPYITIVGGTTLTTSGPGGAWLSEQVWNWDNGFGSSGGISTSYAIPNWQQSIDMTANQGSTTFRNIPDVALTADNVFVIADNGQQEYLGGTSCATPLWAALTALVNEQSVKASSNTVGFLNPALYSLGNGSHYAYTFHDVTTGNNEWSQSPTKFTAVPGYDLCTGWGTPQGANLIDALAPPDVLVIFPGGAFAWTGYVGGPFVDSTQAFTLTNAGAATLNWTAGASSTWLDLSSTSGSLGPGAASITVTISTNSAVMNLPAGDYTNTVWFTNLSDGVVQTRQFILQIKDDLQILPAEGLAFSRSVVRPFTITNQSFTLTNVSGAALNWAVVNTSAWLNVSLSSGALSSAGSLPVTVSLTPAALSLGLGTFSNTLWFINLNDLVVQSCPVAISVLPLLVNGGFETGDFTGWTLGGNTNGYLLFVTSSNRFVHSGNYAAAFGMEGSLGFISQTVPTIPGAHYTLSLWLFSPDGQTPNQFEVVWDGRLLDSAVNMAARPWTKLQFPVTATTTTTTLQIGGRDDPSYLAVDDVSLDLEPFLITPSAGFVSTGYVGGPFSITNQNFALTNIGGSALSWGMANTSVWLNASSLGGVLAPGAGGIVSISLSPAAASLPVGQFTNTVLLTNLGDGLVQSRQFALQVQPAPEPLEILPATALVFSRPIGGAFSPAGQSFVLTNLGTTPLNWALAGTSPWFSALPGSGLISPGGPSATVTLALNGSAAALPSGNYTNTLWFTNLSDGTVQSREVLLLTLPLVQNGGFETGDFSFWTQTGDFSYCSVSTSSLYTHSGSYGASLGPQGALGYLSQSLPTTAGQSYLLSFWLDSPDGLAPNEFSVSWNGLTLFDQVNLGTIGWTNLQYLVTASGPSTVIQFGFRNDQSYFGFDDVSVLPVPTPSFQSVTKAANALRFSWSAQVGRNYQVQYATHLAPADWTNLGGAVTATNATMMVSDPIGPGGNVMRFYRVLLLP